MSPVCSGLVLEGERSDPLQEGQGQWCLAVPEPGELGAGASDSPVEIFRCSRWDPSGDGAEIWGPFQRDGTIPQSNNDRRSRADEPCSAALAVRCQLEPGASLEIPVVISWDLPVTSFATGIRALRRYTDAFGAGGDNAALIAAEALREWPTWRETIEGWQAPVAGALRAARIPSHGSVQ